LLASLKLSFLSPSTGSGLELFSDAQTNWEDEEYCTLGFVPNLALWVRFHRESERENNHQIAAVHNM
jgi:hypothetical protein